MFGQPKRRHAIDQAKVNGFGLASLIVIHGLKGNIKDFGRGGTVNIELMSKRMEQSCIAGEVRHDSQFNLRVIGRDNLAAQWRNEGLTNTPPFLRPNRNILQIRIAR